MILAQRKHHFNRNKSAVVIRLVCGIFIYFFCEGSASTPGVEEHWTLFTSNRQTQQGTHSSNSSTSHLILGLPLQLKNRNNSPLFIGLLSEEAGMRKGDELVEELQVARTQEGK